MAAIKEILRNVERRPPPQKTQVFVPKILDRAVEKSDVVEISPENLPKGKR